MPALTLEEGEGILSAAKAKGVEMGAKLCVAVVDARGDLMAMFRMDGSPWRSVYICQGKAAASAAWGRASGELTDNAQSPVSRGLMAMLGGRMIPGQGALPAYRNGELVGAVGGSGGSSQEDEDAARGRHRGRRPFGHAVGLHHVPPRGGALDEISSPVLAFPIAPNSCVEGE